MSKRRSSRRDKDPNQAAGRVARVSDVEFEVFDESDDENESDDEEQEGGAVLEEALEILRKEDEEGDE